jgi:hypothetical protein
MGFTPSIPSLQRDVDVEVIIGTGFQLLLTKDRSKLGGLVEKWRLCPAKNGCFTTRNGDET